jgi:hypothetical protein
VTVGEQESIIDRPIVLYRGDREVEIEFTLVGNEFTFSKEGNVIKSVNASHGQLVLNTPSGEHMFSELAECHEGKVVFVVTKEMIDEFVEMGFYSFQIRLYDSAEMKSRVTIPPVMNGFDIRNPIAAEDETNAVDQGIVGYARIFKDQSNEELPTFDSKDNYNKTEWVHHDVITENKLNKIEDALYSINTKAKESDVFMLNTLDQVKKDADTYIKEHIAEVEANAAEFERNLNTDVQKFKIDTNAAMSTHKNEVSEVVDGFSGAIENINSQLEQKVKYVNYEMFGAKSDGIFDDGIAIKACHEYANKNNLPVVSLGGKYYIKETRGIIVKTSVDFGNSKIYIDESHNSNTPLFQIKGENESYKMNSEDVSKLYEYIKPYTSFIDDDFIKKYNNSLLIVDDVGTVVCKRKHDSKNNIKNLRELFYIDGNSQVLGDINYNFKSLNARITSCTVYKTDNNYLSFKNGEFILSGGNRVAYGGIVVSCNRSRVNISNQVISTVNQNLTTHEINGFYYIDKCYDVTLENIKTEPNKKLNNGTYKFVVHNSINVKLKNITCVGSSKDYWGCIETSYVKDMYYYNCYLNRIDTHWYICNLTVRDSHIGDSGINISGFGTALFDNVTRTGGDSFLAHRGDYGGLWDGNIIIKNCKYKVGYNSTKNSAWVISHYVDSEYDYNLQPVIAKGIYIDCFEFICEDGNEDKHYGILINGCTKGFVGGSKKTPIIVPQEIICTNIKVLGRESGLSELFRGLYNPHVLNTGKDGVYSLDNKNIKTNAYWKFENIQCKKYYNSPTVFDIYNQNSDYVAHLSIYGTNESYNNKSLRPKVEIKNCGEIVIMPFASESVFIIDDCIINHFDSYHQGSSSNHKGKVYFNKCIFEGDVLDLNYPPFRFRSELGTFLRDCYIDIPKVNGNKEIDKWLKLGFVDSKGTGLRGFYNNTIVSDKFDPQPALSIKKELLRSSIITDLINYRTPLPLAGQFSELPSAGNIMEGHTYYDKSNNRLLIWNGTNWVTATGNVAK